MLEEGIRAELLSAKAFGGEDPDTIARRLDDWFHQEPPIIIHDIIPVSYQNTAGVLVIYRKR